MKVVPLRSTPGADLRLALDAWMLQQSEQAGCVISGIGSLSAARLRLPGQKTITALNDDLEILSLVGTLSPDGAHLHIAIAGSTGAVIGGHLCSGSLVRTTAELVLGLLPEWEFRREQDPATGCAELLIRPARSEMLATSAQPAVAS
ncbi:DNA-binding protein [Synechococcus sp. J7-Johnson]|uniref:PPC domain-containing DNA-binding protein n=1 Tax=Synechococcus sp. J7-Johnson TaxID=2823737 RepID=UPI0020CBC184|nr:PPC domain-containing DNA-binding protein [Synechococcus sp. J7-Johnson]MCP9842037.1 DNA-binding protein [Synechococcus sp. J7-Johnson]